MGPPLNIWPYTNRIPEGPKDHKKTQNRASDYSSIGKCLVLNTVRFLKMFVCNFAIIFVTIQILFSCKPVHGGPVVLNLDYMQGPVPLARNIRHLPCISRRTGQEGLCMFAIDCLKANGTHLGTCIDRFYFGSCCQIPDKTILPQIIGNNIDDNSIDSSSFVHPQTEDKISTTVSKLPDLFSTKKPVSENTISTIFENAITKKPLLEDDISKTSTKKPTTEYTDTTKGVQDKHETESPEMKTDDMTTLDNKIPNDEENLKVTTALVIETTSKKLKATTTTIAPEVTTEIPIKLSTFQTVSEDNKFVTENPARNETEFNKTVSTTEFVRPTRPPTRKPTYKPRPTYKPSNFTRPTYGLTTRKPLPTKPISTIYNSTRKPPYRPPPKRPSTKKPLPSPPRLNITILPQSTSSRPTFTRPLTPIITYINNTATTLEEKPSTTLSTSTVTTTTTEPPTTTNKPLTTEKVVEIAPPTVISTSTTTEAATTTEKSTPTFSATINTESSHLEPIKETTLAEEIVTEKETIPTGPETNEVTEVPIPETTALLTVEPLTTSTTFSSTTSTTPMPSTTSMSSTTSRPTTTTRPTSTSSTTFPPLVTWTNAGESVTKTPEKPTTTLEDETWSPITPPDGWILISTVPPKPETTTSTTTTTTTSTKTTEPPTTEPPTTKPQPTTATEPETTQPETTVAVTEAEFTEKPTTTEITTPESTQPPTPVVTTEPSTTTSSSTTSTKSTSETTDSPLMEFTVNVTMTPTAATTFESGLSTSSSVDLGVSAPSSVELGLSTPSSVDVGLSTLSSENTTVSLTGSTSASVNITTAAPSDVDKTMTVSPLNATSASSTIPPEFTPTDQVNMSDYKDVCGRRLWPQGRIVGGAKSGFGQWPWQISLRQYRTSTYLHKCGAALLNENWAITAAHCVEHVPPSELLVRLGEHDLANEDEPYGFAERRVQIVASHPHFDPATFEYDLALLRFYEPVTFQPNILPVCVPDTDEDYVGKTAYVTGWGRLYDEGPLPSVLQEVQVPVINNTACEAMYQAAGYNEHIPNIFICAGWRKGGSDSCEGDSGGPMVIQRDRDKRFVLGGVISWGIGCAEPNQPGVYTRISEFRDWINQILQF